MKAIVLGLFFTVLVGCWTAGVHAAVLNLDAAAALAGPTSMVWTNSSLWVGGIVPTSNSAADTVNINAVNLNNRQITLSTSSLVVRNLNIDCPVSGLAFSISLRNYNVSAVNITLTGSCQFFWAGSSQFDTFDVSDSWVAATMSLGTTVGKLTVGRYFNVTTYSGSAAGTRIVIPSIESARNLRSRVNMVGPIGFASLNAATSIEWYNWDLRKSGFTNPVFDLQAGQLTLVDSSVQDITFNVGDASAATITLNNTLTNCQVFLKTPTASGQMSKLVTNGRATLLELGQGRGSQLSINGNLTTNTYAYRPEVPARPYSNPTEIFVARGAVFKWSILSSIVSTAPLGPNTRFWINGTVQMGYGSIGIASTQIGITTPEVGSSVVIACQDNAAEIISDPIAFGPHSFLYGCNFRTLESPWAQNFPIVAVNAGSQVILDGASPYLPTRFSANTTFAGTLLSLPSATPKVLSVSGPTFFFNGTLRVSPANAVAIGTTIPMINIAPAPNTVATVEVSSIDPSTLNLVSNATSVGLFRPVPPPEAPPVNVPVAAPAGGSSPSGGGNPPVDNGNAPSGSGNPPVDSGNAPSDNGNAPSAGGNAPSDSGSAPSASGNTPSVGGNAPSASGSSPSASGSAPSASGSAPSVSGNAPSVARSSPGSTNASGSSQTSITVTFVLCVSLLIALFH